MNSGKKATCLTSEVVSETCNKMDVSELPVEPWTVLAHKKPQKDWIPYNPRTMRPPPLADDAKHVKLMSWNVNGLRALLKLESFSALELAQREDFDVLCLQETKLQVSFCFLPSLILSIQETVCFCIMYRWLIAFFFFFFFL